jgi:tRNA threonylcarbamoyl adenosine modification protein YeaZ
MNILALETATDACSVALSINGETRQRFQIAPQRHTELLLPMVGELCAEAGLALPALDVIAVSVGPGAFTGVRVATALAQGLAFAFELPVLGISTLAALALGGSTLRDFRDAHGMAGQFQLSANVYGRVGEPCRVCATKVRRIVQAQRSTFFCPTCQKR